MWAEAIIPIEVLIIFLSRATNYTMTNLFPIPHSLIILSFDAALSELQAASASCPGRPAHI
jgi:hypothetical protein